MMPVRACESIDDLYMEYSDVKYQVPCPGKGVDYSDESIQTHGFSGYYIDWHGDEIRPNRFSRGQTYRITASPDGHEKLHYVKFRGVDSGKEFEFYPNW